MNPPGSSADRCVDRNISVVTVGPLPAPLWLDSADNLGDAVAVSETQTAKEAVRKAGEGRRKSEA